MPLSLAAPPLFPPAEVMGRLAISNSGFVFDPVSGASYTVNPSGLAILRALQSGCTQMDDLMHILAEEFTAPRNVLERDVIEFSGRLREVFRGSIK